VPRWFRYYLGVSYALFYVEAAALMTVGIHFPPPAPPYFVPPAIIIIVPVPNHPYEKDTWWNTWEERDI